MKNRGFTLIEMIVVLMLIGIGLMIVIPIIAGDTSMLNSGNVSFGINGMMETRCVDGYKFMIGRNGSARQVMDELGHGVRCN